MDDHDPDSPEGRAGAAEVMPAGRPDSGRAGLDRRRVIGAAIAFVDANGLAALTMRRLGSALGVEAMTLYRYVPGRENLLDGVVESVLDELYGDPDVHMDGAHGWHDFLQRLAHGVRRIALAHPEVFPLIATRPPSAPWLRPPLRSLRWLESFLSVMLADGFSEEAAVAAYRAYSSFLLGHLLLEVSHRGVKISPEDEPDGAVAAAADDLRLYPTIQRLEPLLSLDESAAEFEESLETLLERLERVLTESPGTSARRASP